MSRAQGAPLAGLRVVDCSTEIAGPYCTKLLVDAGADVVKVEPPGGDPLRRWSASGAPIAEGGSGALFRYLNASKRSIVLDLEARGGRDALMDLAAAADLVVESLPVATARALDLTHEALAARCASLSLVSITPWGRTGPYAERPSTDFTLQAATGSTAFRGLPERGPVCAGGRIGEWVAGTYAAVGALSAWLSARRSGEGRHVDLAIFEAMLLSLTIYHDLDGQWHEGPLPQAIEIPSIEPARDGWVGFCTITGQQWVDFCSLIGHPEVAKDERFLDAKVRMQHLPFMQEIIHAWTRERTVDEIVEIASLMRIPVAPVGNGQTLPEMDHLVERGVFVRNPAGFLQPRVPYRLGDASPPAPGRAPALDEHADSVRAELRDARPAASEPEGDGVLPLEGLRVVDLSAFWAGPVAASTLATLGADVVKIESIQRPDGMRFAGAVRNERMWEWSPVFAGANPGKRDVTLRLDSEAGMALLRRLVETADVVMENFSPRVVEHFGLDWEAVHELNPRAIMLRMPAFGLDGPWRERTGFAMTIEQVSGLAWMTGYPDLPLVVRGACDPVGGMHAVFALLLALEQRRRTGEGQLVEVPLLEVALNIAAEQVIEHSANGCLLTRDENRGPCAAPQGVYCCTDGSFVAIAVANDAQWRALRTLLDEPGWASDPALDTESGRRAAHDDIDTHLGSWIADQDPGRAVDSLLAAGVPAERVVNSHFVMPHPQLEHRGFFKTLEHPETGPTRYPSWPMGPTALASEPLRSPPPTLGQHNEEILGGELGLTEDELEALREAKIIGTRPSFM